MPRKVDHDERRLLVARVVEELVHERGIEALTIRDVARRAGYSTSIVSHYFASKLELFIFTHRMARARAEARLTERMSEGQGLVSCLSAILPVDVEGKRDWHTWFSLWGMAPVAPAVNAERLAGTSGANVIFVDLLRQAQEKGEIAASVNPVADAAKVQVIINGIASLVLQDEASWPQERQLMTLREMLDASFGAKTV